MGRLILALLAGLFVASAIAGDCAPSVADLDYRLVDTRPHRVKAFTQGLTIADGQLLETTGRYGASRLSIHTLTGEALRSAALPRNRFGEGATVLGQRIWWLSWKAGEARVYDFANLKLLAVQRYSGEGWGLTSDGRHLYMSDGSAQIRVRRPQDFAPIRRITVRDAAGPVQRLNELEWVGGQIYANIWGSDHIVRFSADSGCVTGWLDLGELWPHRERPPGTDVLNGIAHEPQSGHLWVTGKYWPKIYVLEVIEPAADEHDAEAVE